MYKSLNLFLYQSSYYEDLVAELFDIEYRKRKICKKINNLQEFPNLDRKTQIEFHRLINCERKILGELLKENGLASHLFGSLDSYKEEDDEINWK